MLLRILTKATACAKHIPDGGICADRANMDTVDADIHYDTNHCAENPCDNKVVRLVGAIDIDNVCDGFQGRT